MTPWWDSTWLWAGVGIVVGAVVLALIAVVLVVAATRLRTPRR